MARYFDSTDLFFPSCEWPPHILRLSGKSHKSNQERYIFFYFLVANGLDPDTASQWTLLSRVRPDGKPLYEGYDRAAYDQMKYLRDKAKNGELFEKGYCFDMRKGYVPTQVIQVPKRIEYFTYTEYDPYK